MICRTGYGRKVRSFPGAFGIVSKISVKIAKREQTHLRWKDRIKIPGTAKAQLSSMGQEEVSLASMSLADGQWYR